MTTPIEPSNPRPTAQTHPHPPLEVPELMKVTPTLQLVRLLKSTDAALHSNRRAALRLQHRHDLLLTELITRIATACKDAGIESPIDVMFAGENQTPEEIEYRTAPETSEMFGN